MTLQRLEIRQVPLVCEWDEETGKVMLGMGPDREVAWARLLTLHNALHRETGVTWVDDEYRERVRNRACLRVGAGAGALVWGATFTPASGVRYVPMMLAAAAGVEMPELEV